MYAIHIVLAHFCLRCKISICIVVTIDIQFSNCNIDKKYIKLPYRNKKPEKVEKRAKKWKKGFFGRHTPPPPHVEMPYTLKPLKIIIIFK